MTENLTTRTLKPEMVTDFKSYKWLISSCLQKSIRRGRFDLAEPYIKFLWEHDRNYITYRLGTILTEDVGIPNVNLINEYLQTNLAKKKIDEAGGLDFILNLVKLACECPKDRSSCDAANLASYYYLPDNYIDNKLSQEDNIKNLCEKFKDTTVPYIDRINIGWILLGNKKFKTDNLPFFDNYLKIEKENQNKNNDFIDSSNSESKTFEIVDNVPLYQSQMVEMKLDESIVNLFKYAHATQVENMSLGLPIMQDLYNNEFNHQKNEAKLKVGQVIENMYVKETTIYHPGTGLQLISAGIDGHTREGKSVYYKFLKSNNSFTQYLKSKSVPDDQHMLIFSHCMFRVEGHEVNKRVFFPTAVQVMRDCEQDILDMKLGMGKKILDFNTIKNIIIQEIPKINMLREQYIKNAEIAKIEKVEPKIKKKKNI